MKEQEHNDRRWILGRLTVLAILVVFSCDIVSAGQDPIKDSAGLCRVKAISLKGLGGEENWSSLGILPDGQVLVGLSSRSGSAVLLVVDPTTGSSRPAVDLARTGHLDSSQRQPKIHVTPVLDSEGCYQFFSHFGLDTHLPLHGSRIGYEGMRRWRWNPNTGEAQELGRLLEGEGAIALNASSNGRKLFVVTFPQAFLLEIDSQSGKVHNYGRTNACYAPRHILMDPWDNPYVLDHQGRFWGVVGAGETLRPLDKLLVVGSDISGNLLAQGFVATASSQNRASWLAMSAWGQLYEIRFRAPGQLEILDHGRPIDRVQNAGWKPAGKRLVTAAGMAQGPDGWIYIGVSGYNRTVDDSGDSYIVRYRIDKGQAQLVARLDGSQVSYICGSNVVDAKAGRVFFAGNHLINDSPYLIVLEDLDK